MKGLNPRPTGHLYDFGPFRADTHKGVLLRDGEPVSLPPKAFDTLVRLLQEAGQVVTKNELMAAVWPDTFVEENNLAQTVSTLRHVLGSGPDGTPYIETQPKRGYRFLAEVAVRGHDGATRAAAEPAAGAAAAPGRMRWRFALAAAALAAALAAVPGLVGRPGPAPARIASVAVLALENLSGDPQQEYFADGMTEQLIAELAKIRALKVISRTSVMRYKGTRQSVREIAAALGVDAVVEGSAQRSGDRVRITARLVEAASDRHLWADSYERELTDVLRVQSEVALAIAREVQVQLTPEERARLAAVHPVDPEAHAAVLRGRYYLNRLTEPEIRKGIEEFRRALEKNPGYAPAYAGLAHAHVLLSDAYRPPAETMPRAKAAAQKALELDDTAADAHAALGYVLFVYDWDWQGGERELRRAIELKPGDAEAHSWYAEILSALGRHEEALAEIERAEALDPLASMVATNNAWDHYVARRYDRAIAVQLRALDLEPGLALARVQLALAYAQAGEPEKAVAAAERAVRDEPSPTIIAMAASALAGAGRGDAARRALEAVKDVKEPYVCPYEVGAGYAVLGERDEAMRWFEKAVADRSMCVPWLGQDPRLDRLRDDPHMRALIERVRLPPSAIRQRS